MPGRDLPHRRFLADGNSGMQSMIDRMLRISQGLDGYGGSDFPALAAEAVERSVQEISDLTAEYDAFDVLELQRMHESPATLDGFHESLADNLPAVISICALILSARGSRTATVPVNVGRPASAVEQIHTLGAEMLTLSSFAGFAEGSNNRYGPLSLLANQYASQEINVKYKQYLDIYDDINSRLFASDEIGDLLKNALGFCYEDFIAVRDAIVSVHSTKLDQLRDTLGRIVEEWEKCAESDQDEEVVGRGRQAYLEMMEFPGQRASFTTEEVAESASIPLDVTAAVLARFSMAFNSTDPAALVRKFLGGWNPFSEAGLLVDADGRYLMLHGPIGMDYFRQIAEDGIKKNTPSAWNRYDRHRTRVSEGLTIATLESALESPCSYAQLKYFKPRAGVSVEQLGAEALGITSLGDEAEADALFLIEDVAICVEVKGRSVSTPAREGHVKKLTTDIEKTIGEASSQAQRLESLIRTNRGLWRGDRTWLDLSAIREIRSIAVCLDDIGPLGTALDELVRAGVVESPRFPLIISLHDLIVIERVSDRPSEFLLYVRRRTESGVSLRFQAVDELDLFMLFEKGGLYVAPNPNEVYSLHPESGRPRRANIRQFEEDSVLTRVGTHTDDLDAWMYYMNGQSEAPAEKPRYETDPEVAKIVDFLADGRKPGWFRFASDILNLASDAQTRLRRGLKDLIARTRADGSFHTMLHCYAGAWGFPSLFLAVCPPKMRHQEASDRLHTYLLAKKHQLRSDRALAIVFDTMGSIVSVRYSNANSGVDDDLDELGRLLRLVPPDKMHASLPPSARRTTHRMRGKRKPKKTPKRR